MKLKEALEIDGREVICLVGGGGKTTFMFSLAKELSTEGSCVITTTTTRIKEPSAEETEKLLICEDEAELFRQLTVEINKHRHITIARQKSMQQKLVGVTENLVSRLADIDRISHIIIEADGSAQRSLKAPNATEPVVPSNTSLVVAVAGIDALGGRLEDKTVFRPEIATELLGMPLGTTISPELMAKLLTHPRGILKETPPDARVIVFINKVDNEDELLKAKQVANEILACGNTGISSILLGQAKSSDPVKCRLIKPL